MATEIGLPLKTIRDVAFTNRLDADVALAIVRWLGVAPEGFVRPHRDGPIPEYMEARTVWRVDATALQVALKAERERRGTTWTAIARELGPGITPAALTRLAGGGRVSIHLLAAAAAWLDQPIQAFTHVLDG